MAVHATTSINITITPRQHELLLLLSLSKQRSVRQIALMLGVSSPAATKAINRLVRKGLVMRVPSEVDHRAVEVCLTAIGLSLLHSQGPVTIESRIEVKLEC